MKPKYIQVSCIEGDKIDLRQSKAVIKHKPDLIFLEIPSNSLKPVTKTKSQPKKVTDEFPWVKSDKYVWDNIIQLQKTGHNILVYDIDGPHDLVSFEYKKNIYPYNKKYPYKTTNLFWWVRIYLRECFMANKIKTILNNYKGKKEPVILIFLQSFHWRHVKFLLSNPTQKEIWDYYFKRFKKLSDKDISNLIKKENKTFFKYWTSPINLLNKS